MFDEDSDSTELAEVLSDVAFRTRWLSVFVPEGLMIVARQFIAWYPFKKDPVP